MLVNLDRLLNHLSILIFFLLLIRTSRNLKQLQNYPTYEKLRRKNLKTSVGTLTLITFRIGLWTDEENT